MSVNTNRKNTLCIYPGCTRGAQHNGLCHEHMQDVYRAWQEAHRANGVSVEQFTAQFAREHLAPSRLAQQERA